MATKIVKLTSQEDVIGDYEEIDGKCFLSKPAKLMMFPTENGGMGMALMPWVPWTDDEKVELRKDCILLQPMNPSGDVRNEYNQRFGSGIVAPVKGKGIIV